MKSFIVDQAAHMLHSAAIFFLRDQGERDSVYVVFLCSYMYDIVYIMKSNL